MIVVKPWNNNEYNCELSDMVGRVFTSVEATDYDLVFTDGEWRFTFHHLQDCCEDVQIDDIVGDLNDLIGEPLLIAEEVSSEDTPPKNEWDAQESYTWTFYKFATRKGYVDVKWYGVSNGYYSESVDLKAEKM